ncbi:Hypothetical_protein [Hexamita inflata]|uniref:Hypothetical_protein n=1 Tax=Hexamita inflata TaxID=28002 RepID=A0AA86V6P1_9EUKA|nr:Hypothetical protein HINF_LOCUS65987 [Hexamita inflata]
MYECYRNYILDSDFELGAHALFSSLSGVEGIHYREIETDKCVQYQINGKQNQLQQNDFIVIKKVLKEQIIEMDPLVVEFVGTTTYLTMADSISIGFLCAAAVVSLECGMFYIWLYASQKKKKASRSELQQLVDECISKEGTFTFKFKFHNVVCKQSKSQIHCISL